MQVPGSPPRQPSDRDRVIVAQVIAQAWKDPGYKLRFLTNPKDVLQEAGIQGIPEDVQIRVMENTLNRKYFVLPDNNHPFSTYRAPLAAVIANAVPLAPEVEMIFVQNTENVIHLVLPMVPLDYQEELRKELQVTHVELLQASGWEAVNLYTSANAVAEANAAAVQNVAAATEVAGAAVAVAVVGVVLI